MSKVKVELKERSYDIYIGVDNLPLLGTLLEEKKAGNKIVVITDENVGRLYGPAVKNSLKAKGFMVNYVEVPAGEKSKSLRIVNRLYDKLVQFKTQRDSWIVALGGGVVGDLAGYVAATYMRGINLVQVPTTVVAQVDSSVGGKTGVNHPRGKNLIGSFYQPQLVLIDVKTLATLPAREIRNGLAEVVKYGVIKNKVLFDFTEKQAQYLRMPPIDVDFKVWQTIVGESLKIKAEVVAKDEKEKGLRMILNFGHTIGHAIETLTVYKKYRHGEAVAIGMIAATVIAAQRKLISAKVVDRLRELILRLGLPPAVEKLKASRVLQALALDKKVKGGKVRFVLPTKIGMVKVFDNVSVNIVRKALREIGCK